MTSVLNLEERGNHGCMAGVLTLLGHSDFQALLQSTVLAAVASDLVDDAIFLPVTSVHHVLLDASPKEALRDGGRQMWTGVGEGRLIKKQHSVEMKLYCQKRGGRCFKEGSQTRVRACKSNLSKSQILKGLLWHNRARQSNSTSQKYWCFSSKGLKFKMGKYLVTATWFRQHKKSYRFNC